MKNNFKKANKTNENKMISSSRLEMIFLIETEVVHDVSKEAFFLTWSRLTGGVVTLPLAIPFFFEFLRFVSLKAAMKTNRIFWTSLSGQIGFQATFADATNEGLDLEVTTVRRLRLDHLLLLREGFLAGTNFIEICWFFHDAIV